MRLTNEDIVAEFSLRLEKEKSIKKKVLLKKIIDEIKQFSN